MGIIEVKSDFSKLKQSLDKMNKGLEDVKRLTKSDFRSRVPRQVNKGVKAKYKIGNRVGQDKPSWHSSGDFSGELKYKTSPIGIENFGMSPKEAPGRQEEATYIPAMHARIHLPLPYTISYAIKKPTQIGVTASGRRKLLHHNFSVQSTKGYFVARGLAWKRKGPNAKSVEVMKTLSVSAMIVNDAKEGVEKNIKEMLENRLANHIRNKMGLD